MRVRDDDSSDELEFSMAPLIDVVFQLLVFFLVATSWANRESELDVELPAAQSSSPARTTPDELVIDVRRDGSFSVKGRVVERVDLDRELASVARSNPRTPVTIRGDRLVHHEDVVAVMDACGVAGLVNLAVGTLETPR